MTGTPRVHRRAWAGLAAVLVAAFALVALSPSVAGAAATCDPSTFRNPDGSFDAAGYLQCASPSLSEGEVVPGGTIIFKGGGFMPESSITVTLFSDPVVLGTTTADSQGLFTFEAVIPSDTPAGAHTLVASGVDPDGNPLEVALEITIVEPAVAAAAAATTTSGALPYTGSDIGRYVALGAGLAAIGGAAFWGARRARATSTAA